MPPQTRLFVGNLPENTDENTLRDAFVSYGDITNLELKSKPAAEEESKKFAFITLSSDDYNIESCLKHFSINNFQGSRLYVTRARESFLERLQRERQQAQQKDAVKNQEPVIPKIQPVLKLSEKLNPRKRTFDNQDSQQNGFQSPATSKFADKNREFAHHNSEREKPQKLVNNKVHSGTKVARETPVLTEADKKKQDADKKRLESIKKKKQDFKQKQMIIKTGLVGIDKAQNKKLIFSDSDNETQQEEHKNSKSNNILKSSGLFDDDDSEGEVNFEIKEQFEGKKGQKVLELQSRYKSDKRFVLDERFIEDDEQEEAEAVEVGQSDEKHKQLNILQDVLGIAIKSANRPDTQDKKKKTKPGMLRFDPSHPEHSKFLAPVEEKPEPVKKKKKKGQEKAEEIVELPPKIEVPTVEVSKEQFYKVSDALKEAIVQPNSFSLRSLFSKGDDDEEKEQIQQDHTYIPLSNPAGPRVKNPLEPGERNPFKYDSSDSEDEAEEPKAKEVMEVKAVWKENLFFSKEDHRLLEGLSFFNAKPEREGQKDRREMKFVMKKRLHNRERKEHENMFKKKIGGRRKTQKKSFRKRNS